MVEHVGADSGDELLPALAASLRRDLRLDFVAIDVRDLRRLATRSLARPGDHVRADRASSISTARSSAGWSSDGSTARRCAPATSTCSTSSSVRSALAVGWVRLAADLRRSSVAIVSAREEERRRLRRDLHDGLGPALTGVSLGLRTAVRQLERVPTPTALLAVARSCSSAPPTRSTRSSSRSSGSCATCVRRRSTSSDSSTRSASSPRTFDDELEIHALVPSAPVELPAAVEVATYRIVTEAVTNVVRHAQAARCWLTISAGPTVDIDVVDDGIGVNGDAHDGVGLDGDARAGGRARRHACEVEPRPARHPHPRRLPAVLP